MRRANTVIGLPVMTMDGSRQIGTINDIAYSPERERVVGFLVDGADHNALPWSAVSAIKADTVLIRDEGMLVDTDDAPEINRAVDSDIQFNEMNVTDADDNDLGTIEDTFFDERTGRIAGFQVHAEDTSGWFGGDEQRQYGERTKFFLPIERVRDWDEDGMRVGYMGTRSDFYNERFPEGYDERGEYRAA